ncbi:MAG: hypothetical protein M3083_08220 [Actinomycetota bacterium]|nr:hypothetical protein [Actinomycetota bacterium]
MSWFLLVLGILLAICFMAMVLQWAFSPAYRRMSAATDQRPWMLGLVLLPAVVFTVAAFSPEKLGWAPVVSLAPVLVAGIWMRRKHRNRTDLPPALRRMEALPLNPLVTLRHPIRTWTAQWEVLGHPIRIRRETKKWLEERDTSDTA